MRNHLGTLPLPRPPAAPTGPLAGICRVCGCTDQEACVTAIELASYDPPAPGRKLTTCTWIERDLCSRCHGPRRPTRRQAGELARIRARVGPFTIGPGILVGELQVHLQAITPYGYSQQWVTYRTLRMDRHGQIVPTPLAARAAALARR